MASRIRLPLISGFGAARLYARVSDPKYRASPMPTAPAPTPAARMRLHRLRKQSGLTCLTVELRNTEITALVRKGLLQPDSRHDLKAVRKAMYAFLDRSLGGVA